MLFAIVCKDLRILSYLLRDQTERSAHGEDMKDIPYRLVKYKVGKLQYHIIPGKTVDVIISAKQGGQLSVFDNHSLGLTRSSGGIYHVSRALSGADTVPKLLLIHANSFFGHRITIHYRDPSFRQIPQSLLRKRCRGSDDKRGCRILKQVNYTFKRIFG